MQKNRNEQNTNYNQTNRSDAANIHPNLTSYNEWLSSTERLLNRYFDIDQDNFISESERLIKQMHTEPKKFINDFLEIGIVIDRGEQEEQLCIYNGDGKLQGGIYLYGLQNVTEEYWYSSEDAEEYHKCYRYGFTLIAKSFDDFLKDLYCNGSIWDKWNEEDESDDPGELVAIYVY
jgi:hypothetical protein